MEKVITIIFFTLVAILVFGAMMFFAGARPNSSRHRRVFVLTSVLSLVLALVVTIVVASTPSLPEYEFIADHLRLLFFASHFVVAIVLFIIGLLVRLIGPAAPNVKFDIPGRKGYHKTGLVELGYFIHSSAFTLIFVGLSGALIMAAEAIVID